MARKGRCHHTKRLAIPKTVPISNKKQAKYTLSPTPGPHKKSQAIALGIVLREVLGITKTQLETKKVLNTKQVLIDGRAITDPNFPVGLMDLITIPKLSKSYFISVNKKGQLIPTETKSTSKKIAKVIGKHTLKGGKISLNLHDGRNIQSDNNVRVGDSIIISVPKQQIEKVLKFEKGAKCLVVHGKHAGTIATLQSILEKKGAGNSEAVLKAEEEFITLVKYLIVVDSTYEGGQ